MKGQMSERLFCARLLSEALCNPTSNIQNPKSNIAVGEAIAPPMTQQMPPALRGKSGPSEAAWPYRGY